MSYQVISAFPGGLDFRKFKLALPAGTLTELVNAHITPGGEIEKRKKFGQIPLPTQTYGAQETNTGIVVFGSRDADGWTGQETVTGITVDGIIQTQITLTLNGKTPPAVGEAIRVQGSSIAGVNGDWIVTSISPGDVVFVGFVTNINTYQSVSETTGVALIVDPPLSYLRLAHPAGSAIMMTGVSASAFFDGDVYAVTQWSNGETLVFKNTTALTDFYAGKYSSLEGSEYDMALDLCRLIDATGNYTTIKPVLPAYLAFDITGGTAGTFHWIPGIDYNFNRGVTLTTPDGWIGVTTLPVLDAAVNWTTDNATTAQAVVDAINGGSAGTIGFTAYRGEHFGLPTNVVCITPPATDHNGDPLGVNGKDSLAVATGGDVTVFIPQRSASFDVTSIPSNANNAPYSVAAVANQANLKYKLVNNGTAPIAPVGAIGQFSLSAGLPNNFSTGAITATANLPADGSTLTVGSVTYTFQTTITGVANEIKIGTTPAATLTNLIAAINLTSGSGTLYSPATQINPDCSASALTGSTTTLTATLGGVAGNSLALAQSAAFFTLSIFAGGGSNASGTITSNGTNVSDGNTVTIGSKTYRFKNTPAAAFDVKIGAAANDTLANLRLAINLKGSAGVNYFTGTTANPDVKALNLDTTNHVLHLAALASGSGGNSLALTTTATTLALSRATLGGGGVDDNAVTRITVAGVDLLQGSQVGVAKNLDRLVADVVATINANQTISGFSASASGNIISLAALSPGTTYNNAEVVVTATGTVCIASCNLNIGAQAGQILESISGNNDSNMLEGATTLTFQDADNFGETVNDFVKRIADSINRKPGAVYLACPDGNVLHVSSRVVSSSDVAENINVASTTTAIGGATTTLTITLATNPYIAWLKTNMDVFGINVYWQTLGSPNSAVVLVSGGVAPFTYSWRRISGKYGKAQITDASQKNQWWKTSTFAGTQSTTIATQLAEEWVCDVTDAVSNKATSPSVYIS